MVPVAAEVAGESIPEAERGVAVGRFQPEEKALPSESVVVSTSAMDDADVAGGAAAPLQQQSTDPQGRSEDVVGPAGFVGGPTPEDVEDADHAGTVDRESQAPFDEAQSGLDEGLGSLDGVGRVVDADHRHGESVEPVHGGPGERAEADVDHRGVGVGARGVEELGVELAHEGVEGVEATSAGLLVTGGGSGHGLG